QVALQAPLALGGQAGGDGDELLGLAVQDRRLVGLLVELEVDLAEARLHHGVGAGLLRRLGMSAVVILGEGHGVLLLRRGRRLAGRPLHGRPLLHLAHRFPLQCAVAGTLPAPRPPSAPPGPPRPSSPAGPSRRAPPWLLPGTTSTRARSPAAAFSSKAIS